MLKKEIIWRELLFQAIEKKRVKFQQQEIAKKFGFSLSTVNNALKIPRKSGAVKVTSRYFIIQDPEKLLYLWASFRNLDRDIIYQTFIDKPIKQIEKIVPPEIVYGAYSAYLKKFKQAPADYSKIYIYTKEKNLAKIKKRFPPSKKTPNLIVLNADQFLSDYGQATNLSQTFVDIWNLPEWYATDFHKNLKQKIHGILA